MTPRFDLTDNLLDEALRIDASAPPELRASIRSAVAASPRGTALHLWPRTMQPRPSFFVVMLLAAVLLAIVAVAVGSRLLDLRRETSVVPSPSPSLPALTVADGSFTLGEWEDAAAVGLTFEYRWPQSIGPMEIATQSTAVGFAQGSGGLDYGWLPTESGRTFAEGARGVVLADMTGAYMREDAPPPAPASAAELFEQLQAFKPIGRNNGYLFEDIRQARLAGFRALSAEVTSARGYSYTALERAAGGTHINLLGHSRLIAADIDGRIIVAQLWAREAPGRDMPADAWMPLAEFVDSLVLVPSAPRPTANGSFVLSRWDDSGSAGLEFSYRWPRNHPMSFASRPGLVGLAVGTDGLTYGRDAGDPQAVRGVVFADVTGASWARDASTLFGAQVSSEPVGDPTYWNGGEQAIGLFGSPAYGATLARPAGFASTFLDMGDTTDALNLEGVSHWVFADVADRVVLIQIWAGSRYDSSTLYDEGLLESWLPTAMEFVRSLTVNSQ